MTNDGATILRAVGVDNPAAKVLVEMSRVQVFLLFSNGRRDFSLHGMFLWLLRWFAEEIRMHIEEPLFWRLRQKFIFTSSHMFNFWGGGGAFIGFLVII